MFRCLTVAGLFAGLFAALSCNSQIKRHAISGTVTFKGNLIKSGTINFSSEGDGKYVATGTIVDGKYAIPAFSGLPPGKYAVAISYPDPNIPAPRPDEPPGESTLARELLPAKYNEQSELTAEIKQGPNEVNFTLE